MEPPHMFFFSWPQELPLYAEPKKHGLKWSGWSVVGCGYPDPSRATETWRAKCYVFYLQQGFSHCFDASEGLRSSKQIYLFVCRQTLMLERGIDLRTDLRIANYFQYLYSINIIYDYGLAHHYERWKRTEAKSSSKKPGPRSCVVTPYFCTFLDTLW